MKPRINTNERKFKNRQIDFIIKKLFCVNSCIFVFKSIFFLIFFLSYYLFSAEKTIKKITADETEYNRKENIIKFNNNVKVELKNGVIYCDKAVYDEKKVIINCESNVYSVLTSTSDGAIVEVKSSYAKYNGEETVLEFTGEPYVVYTSSENEKEQIQTKFFADKIFFNQKSEMVYCEKNVKVITKEGELLCNTAEYSIKTKILNLNSVAETDNTGSRLKFVSTKEDFNIKSFAANTAVMNLEKDTIQLSGKVEIMF